MGQTFAHPLGATRERSWVGGEVEWSFYHLLSVQAGLQRPPDVKKGGRWLAAAGRPYVFLPPAK